MTRRQGRDCHHRARYSSGPPAGRCRPGVRYVRRRASLLLSIASSTSSLALSSTPSFAVTAGTIIAGLVGAVIAGPVVAVANGLVRYATH